MTAFGRIGSRCVVRPRAGCLGAVAGRYDHRPGSIGARRRGMVDSCAGTAGEGLPSTYRAGSSSHEGGVKMRASVAITLAVCSGATLAATGQPSASERLDAVAAELDARESELEARTFWGEPDSALAESLAHVRWAGWGFSLVDAASWDTPRG